MKPFVAYYRVSTKHQEASQAGLNAQRFDVAQYLAHNEPESELIAEYTEIESGRKNNRPKLQEAIQLCKKEKAVLLIAKLDRLARNVFFVSGLLESKIDFIAVDTPHANKTMIQLLAVFAEYERDMISQRIKDALAQKKAEGVQLGKMGKVRAAENKAKAKAFAKSLEPLLLELESQGITASQKVADELNRQKIPTARGGRWHSQTVLNLRKRLNNQSL